MAAEVGGKCVACRSADHRTIRAYRNESPSGRRLFHNAVIFECLQCGLCQVAPLQGDDALERYYATDYRAGRRYGADAAKAATFPRDNLFFFHRGRSVTELLRSHLAADRPMKSSTSAPDSDTSCTLWESLSTSAPGGPRAL